MTWQPPAGDGGSPITSYTITASPDTATTTVDGNTYQAALSGLSDVNADDFTVTANNAEGSSTGADQEIGNTGQTEIEQDIGVSIDPTTDESTLIDDNAEQTTVNADGTTTTQSLTPDTTYLTDDSGALAAAGAPGTDSNNVQKNCELGTSATTGNQHPFNSEHGGSSVGYADAWINHFFSIDNAKKVGGVEQYEAVLCTHGGGHTIGDQVYNDGATLSENALTTDSTNKNTLWNADWGSASKSVSSVSSGYSWTLGGDWQGIQASISGTESTTTVQNQSEDTGSQRGDGHYGKNYPSYLNQYDPVRVNTEWNALTTNGRSTDWVGDTAWVIYLYPMGTGPHKFYSVVIMDLCNVAPASGNGEGCSGHGGGVTKD